MTGPASGSALISEIMASNDSTLADEDGDFSDWVEIHNPTDGAIDLAGWYLTDNAGDLTKWRFPAVVLDAGDFLLVFASGKGRAVAGKELHTNFRLDGDGEYLGLVLPDGESVVSEFLPRFPEQRPDVSFGFMPGVGQPRYFIEPTPGEPNGTGFVGFVGDLRIGFERGFYNEPFLLEISTQTPEALIRYTRNGSPPSLTSGEVYLDPIPVTRTTVLRAAAFKNGYVPTQVETHTYLFLDDVIRQPEMDPDVVNDPAYSGIIRDALRSIPSFSIVMNHNDMFGAGGVYAGEAERPASVELLNPNGRRGFQIDCSVEKHSDASPKTSLRLEFKREYGASKLRYPLFETAPLNADSAVAEFDRLILRSGKNQSWTSGRFKDWVTYVEDPWVRNSQIAMSGIGSHGTFVHLYINGVYWGLYNPAERPDAWFMSAYLGGDKEDYFSTNFNITEGHGQHLGGDPSRFNRMIQLANEKNLELPQNYNEMKQLLDLEDYVDYVILLWFSGFGDGVNNNWYAGSRNEPPGPFWFFMWDGEFIFLDTASPSGHVGAWVPPYFFNSSLYYTPMVKLWQALTENTDFQMLFADRVYKHCFNNGALTDENCRLRLKTLADHVEEAVVGESARWGGGRTRDDEWRSAVEFLDGKMAGNVQVFMDALTSWCRFYTQWRGLHPTVAPPTFNQRGGLFAPGFNLVLSASSTVHFSLDGADPRLSGGGLFPDADAYNGPVELERNSHVMARAFDGGEWSALAEARFAVDSVSRSLRITELMYHPWPLDPEAEFVELKNVGPETLELGGVGLAGGIDFVFPDVHLGPNEYLLTVANETAFENVYGASLPVAGQYTGDLGDDGDTIRLQDWIGTPILDFRYEDDWYPETDGSGYSLTHVDPHHAPPSSWGEMDSWRPSRRLGGTPGTCESPNLQPDMRIDARDLMEFIRCWKGDTLGLPPDFNCDGVVDGLDVIVFQTEWCQPTLP